MSGECATNDYLIFCEVTSLNVVHRVKLNKYLGTIGRILFIRAIQVMSIRWISFVLFVSSLSATSINQPNLTSSPSWNSKPIILANQETVGNDPLNIFIDENNTILVAARSLNSILIWKRRNQLIKGSSSSYLRPNSVFATRNSTIYVGVDENSKKVKRCSLDATNCVDIMNTPDVCRSLFIDRNETIYCSLDYQNQVIKKSLIDNSNPKIAAGNCTGQGWFSDCRLNGPKGIFVAKNFSLYVADCGNDRVRMYQPNSLNGITILTGKGSGTVSLNCPIDVAMDSNAILFVLNWGDGKIISVGTTTTQCVINCDRRIFSVQSAWSFPSSFSFDTYGNIYVSNNGRNCIEKFTIKQNLTGILEIFYNQPILPESASWNENATIVIDRHGTNGSIVDFFITTSDDIYVNFQFTSIVQVWNNRTNISSRMIHSNSSNISSIFSTSNGDVYIQTNNETEFYVEKWTLNKTVTKVMYVNSYCFSLFVDIFGSIYCSLSEHHQVIKKSFNQSVNVTTIIAGYANRSNGSATDQLDSPRSIFVTSDLDLYVADCGNNRIQLFISGDRNGTTLIDTRNGSLHCPTGLVLDANGRIFITDYHNHRILMIESDEFKCIIGCSAASIPATNSLIHPTRLSFDSIGNLLVLDNGNSRIQNFSVEEIIKIEIMNTSYFAPPSCPGVNNIGLNCDVSNEPCDILQPCHNNGTCSNTNDGLIGFECSCLFGFNGSQCEIDMRPCQPTTCWNNGICNETSSTTFQCQCSAEWTGDQCQTKVNFCENIICLNNAVCQPLVGDYRCECLGDAFSGRHCEITSSRIVTNQMISKSFGYIATIAICVLISLIIGLDSLKYGFGIDSSDPIQRKQQQRPKIKRKAKTIVQINRPVYVPGDWNV